MAKSKNLTINTNFATAIGLTAVLAVPRMYYNAHEEVLRTADRIRRWKTQISQGRTVENPPMPAIFSVEVTKEFWRLVPTWGLYLGVAYFLTHRK